MGCASRGGDVAAVLRGDDSADVTGELERQRHYDAAQFVRGQTAAPSDVFQTVAVPQRSVS